MLFRSILDSILTFNMKLCSLSGPISLAARTKAWVYRRLFAGILGSNPAGGMDVCVECCVLSGRGLCNGLITYLGKSYRMWCVVVCDLETSRMRRPWPALGRSATGKKKVLLQSLFRHTLFYPRSNSCVSKCT